MPFKHLSNMLITIHGRAGSPKADISPDDSSTQVKEIQGDNLLTLSFTHHEYISLDVDDYVDFEGERYWLTEACRPRQKSTMEWVYDLKLYGIESLLKDFLVIKRVDGEDDPVFTLTAPPREHVAMIVACMNDGMVGMADWKVGQVDGTENIVIDYHGKYCDEALREIAAKVGAEWWTEGQTVNVCRCEHGEPVVLGYDKGLTSIDPGTASNVKFYTRLYPVGSSRNIDPEKYGHARLQLPDGRKYVEINADKHGRVDHYEDAAFADIYPRRTGVVSSVRSEVKTGEDGKPFTIWYFKDNNLPFDPNNYEIAHLVKRVSFQEGSELAGLGEEDNGTYYFEVNFNSSTREFEIITIWPYDDETQLPGGSLVPKAGDKYILWNIRMPDEYYTLAEKELLTAVNRYNAEHGLDVSVFKATTDYVWIEDNKVELSIGRRVRLESSFYFPETDHRDSRVTKITRKVNLPTLMDLEIGDAISRTAMQRMSDGITDARNYAKSMFESASLPDIIRTGDKTPPTDFNLFSARRCLEEAISRKRPDRAEGRIAFEDGLESGTFVNGRMGAAIDSAGNTEVESMKVRKGASVGVDLSVGRRVTVGNYIPGVSGAVIYVDDNGEAHIETAELTVNKKLKAKEVEVQEQTWVGGAQTNSPAGMICERVEQIPPASADPNVLVFVTGWKCLFRTESPDGRKIHNQFRVGDFARCETFNLMRDSDGMTVNRYYWRKVTEVGYETDGEGLSWGYIILSNKAGEYDRASTCAPAAGDSIVTVGNDHDPERQNLIISASYGEGSPYIYQFQGINSFSLSKDRLKTVISPAGNLFTGRFRVEAEGRDPEDLDDYLGHRTPYSLRPSTSAVLVYHTEDPDSGEAVTRFSPREITCGVLHAAGTGKSETVPYPYGDNIRVSYVVRKFDPEAGTSVDYPAEPYTGDAIFPEEEMRSVTFYLVVDNVIADKVAVSIQADATSLESEYRTSLEVTEAAINQQVEKTNYLERRVGTLSVTADRIMGKVGRISGNLVKFTKGMWDNPTQDLSVDEEPENGGFYAEQGADLSGPYQTFRCEVDKTLFKLNTDYTLSLEVTFQDEEEMSAITQNKMVFRASISDVTQSVFLCPWVAPDVREFIPGEPTPIVFRLHSSATFPTNRMFLQFIIRDWDDRTSLLRLSFREIKLEAGTVATSWVPGDQDLESAIIQQADQIAMSVKVDGKERAGMTLDAEQGITLRADKVKINNGDKIAALFTDGILNANLIQVGKLSTIVDGLRRITVGEYDDGFIRFYHRDGVTVALKLGLDNVSLEDPQTVTPIIPQPGTATPAAEDGTVTIRPSLNGKPAVMQVFDESGTLKWVLFLDGPVTPDTQTYSWRSWSLVPESAQNSHALRTTATIKAQEYWQFKVKSGVVSDYSQYRDRLFRTRLSDANFSAASVYYVPDGRYFYPSAELAPTTITNPTTRYIRRYFDVSSGKMTAGQIDVDG